MLSLALYSQLQTEISRLLSIAQDLREEIFEKDEKIREISILLDIEESLNLDLNCSINNLKEEIVCIKKENEEIVRISDLQTEKDKLQIAFTIEKEKEWETEKKKNTPISLPLLTRTGEDTYVLITLFLIVLIDIAIFAIIIIVIFSPISLTISAIKISRNTHSTESRMRLLLYIITIISVTVYSVCFPSNGSVNDILSRKNLIQKYLIFKNTFIFNLQND